MAAELSADTPAAVAVPPAPPGRRAAGVALPALLGPAFIACVAYVDPGNIATNTAAGSQYGYLLLWVVLSANGMAVGVQYLAAKLGLATGRSLPELCRERYCAPVCWLLWLQAEAVAMATDVAEFVGAALGLNLLFGVPLFLAGLAIGGLAFLMLGVSQHGRRRFELLIGALLAVILAGFGFELARARPGLAPSVHGIFFPALAGPSSVVLAVGIVGATVMPHVVYLHSALSRDVRREGGVVPVERLLRAARWDVGLAMGLAGIVNLAMLAVAAKLFHGLAVGTLEQAHREFGRLVGPAAAAVFALALLVSGASASSVGTYAGEVVMRGFIDRQIPLWFRRAVTMSPALLLLGLGTNPTEALVLSQVLLSFGIPFALLPLLFLTQDREVMGQLVNRRVTTAVAGAVVALIVSMNTLLLLQTA